MARAHLFRPITDSAGNLLNPCTITVYNADTVAYITQPMFDNENTVTSLSNPFDITTGFIDVWIDTPQRVWLQIASPSMGAAGELNEGNLYLSVDVLPPPAEIVVVNGGALTIINTPNPGDILYAAPTVGEAQWGPPNNVVIPVQGDAGLDVA